ncbi:hypothetical protein D3C85_1638520 [compost metagenome]
MPVMLADLLLVLAGYFEGGFVGFRTAVGEENDIVAFQPFVQLLGQGDGRHMALREREIRQAKELIISRFRQFLAPIANIDTPQAGHAVQKFVPVDIRHP